MAWQSGVMELGGYLLHVKGERREGVMRRRVVWLDGGSFSIFCLGSGRDGRGIEEIRRFGILCG